MADKKFSFDPDKQELVATRDFTRGQLAGEKGKPVDVSGLDAITIEKMVTKSKVAKVQNKK